MLVNHQVNCKWGQAGETGDRVPKIEFHIYIYIYEN